jgi:hypothetical protein
MKRRGRPPASRRSATNKRLPNSSGLHYDCSTTMDRNRFDPALLDEHDPFEIDDDNHPHLAKHSPYAAEDLGDGGLIPTDCLWPPQSTVQPTGFSSPACPAETSSKSHSPHPVPATRGPAGPSASTKPAWTGDHSTKRRMVEWPSP